MSASAIEKTTPNDDPKVISIIEPERDADVINNSPVIVKNWYGCGHTYGNPWDTWHEPGIREQLLWYQWRWNNPGKYGTQLPAGKQLAKELPVLKPDWSTPTAGVRYTWLGHATSLIEMDGIVMLTDPVFMDYCTPYNIPLPSSLAQGARRYRPLPCSVAELPDNLSIILISHNHYDHLDAATVTQLADRFGERLTWFVGEGTRAWMASCGARRIVELSWWQEAVVGEARVVCTPAQHWSVRTLSDRNTMLWCSWAVLGPRNSFYFAGDTGYCAAFSAIGRRLGPFSLSAIPIGSYHPRDFLKWQHVDPAEAVQLHTDIRSRHSVAVHWGTFGLGDDKYNQPPLDLNLALVEAEVPTERFHTTLHGEVLDIVDKEM